MDILIGSYLAILDKIPCLGDGVSIIVIFWWWIYQVFQQTYTELLGEIPISSSELKACTREWLMCYNSANKGNTALCNSTRYLFKLSSMHRSRIEYERNQELNWNQEVAESWERQNFKEESNQ